jgi:hypothetical protein
VSRISWSLAPTARSRPFRLLYLVVAAAADKLFLTTAQSLKHVVGGQQGSRSGQGFDWAVLRRCILVTHPQKFAVILDAPFMHVDLQPLLAL